MFHLQVNPRMVGLPPPAGETEPSVGGNGFMDYICML